MNGITPSQTVGPYLHIGLGAVAMPDGDVRIHGRVLDGAGDPLPDALIEISAPGGSFGRSDTRDGGFELVAVKPEPLDGQAPYLGVSVFARGLLKRVVTRMYFPDEVNANAADPVLSGVDEWRRATLVAVPRARRLAAIRRSPSGA